MAAATTSTAGASVKFIDSTTAFNEIPAVRLDAIEYLKSAQKTSHTSRFIFVRHGESTSNQEKSVAGRTINTELSRQGEAQIEHVKTLLQEVEIDACFSSPTLRAQQTALIIRELDPQTDERLHEKFYGIYEGVAEDVYKPVKKLEEESNSGPHISFDTKFDFKANESMESLRDVCERTREFLRAKDAEYRGKNVLIASHCGLMKALFIKAALEQGFEVDYRAFSLPNAAVIVVELDDQGIHVKATNRLSYIVKQTKT